MATDDEFLQVTLPALDLIHGAADRDRAHDIVGFTAAEVATITGSPRGTVLARVHRGRKALARLVAEEAMRREP